MAEDAERLGIGKACRTCGARSDTLGSVCPACGRPYDPGGLLERLPFTGSFDSPVTSRAAAVAWLVAFVAAGALWILLLVTHPVAGILIAALGFVILVAAIGITNALADRGR